MEPRYTFEKKMGATRYCVNVFFDESENAVSYEERLLDLIRIDDEQQLADESGEKIGSVE